MGLWNVFFGKVKQEPRIPTHTPIPFEAIDPAVRRAIIEARQQQRSLEARMQAITERELAMRGRDENSKQA